MQEPNENIQNNFVTGIPAEREEWIYLIHVEEPNKYKVIKTKLPVSGQEELQEQLPFKLQIIQSAWTLDAEADEADIYNRFTQHCIDGEWFVFGDNAVDQEQFFFLRASFCHPHTLEQFAEAMIDQISSYIGFQPPELDPTVEAIRYIIARIGNRQAAILVEDFVRTKIPRLLTSSHRPVWLQDLNTFLLGGIDIFILLSLESAPLPCLR